MPNFEIEIERTVYERSTLIVQAPDIIEAEKEAETHFDPDAATWTYGGVSMEITSVEELTGDENAE
ncbi:TPA: hypothetical protein ACU9T0_004784 [Burkholderia cenocepacia]|nr:hypothetical protein [Burkholderia cepacia]